MRESSSVPFTELLSETHSFFGVEFKKAMYFFPSFKSATKLLAVEGSQQREHTEGDRKQIFLAVNTS